MSLDRFFTRIGLNCRIFSAFNRTVCQSKGFIGYNISQVLATSYKSARMFRSHDLKSLKINFLVVVLPCVTTTSLYDVRILKTQGQNIKNIFLRYRKILGQIISSIKIS